jgi:hypothetical protein
MMTDSSSVLLFFIDGLGIGSRGPSNPLASLSDAEPIAVFKDEAPNSCGGIVVPTDPRLGVEGRPQSASGQTTILTGINAPSALGYHKQGFPNKALLEILGAHAIFLQLLRNGIRRVTFANAYTQRFFTDRPRWISATTAAVEAAGLPFRTVEDLKADNALYQDFTNAVLLERGEDVTPRSAAEAASVLARITSENQMTLYEYFITDKVGHAQDFTAAHRVLRNLALFLRELLARLDLNRTSVILTSDHGNIEDLSTKSHTLNDVPTIVWGLDQKSIAARIKTLADITPTIVDLLTHRGTRTDANVSPANRAAGGN